MYMILCNYIFIDVHILYTVNISIKNIYTLGQHTAIKTDLKTVKTYENIDVSKAGDIHLIEISGRVVDGAVVAEIDMQGKTFSLISFLLKRGRYIYRPGETNGRSDAMMQWTDPFEMLKLFGLWHPLASFWDWFSMWGGTVCQRVPSIVCEYCHLWQRTHPA